MICIQMDPKIICCCQLSAEDPLCSVSAVASSIKRTIRSLIIFLTLATRKSESHSSAAHVSGKLLKRELLHGHRFHDEDELGSMEKPFWHEIENRPPRFVANDTARDHSTARPHLWCKRIMLDQAKYHKISLINLKTHYQSLMQDVERMTIFFRWKRTTERAQIRLWALVNGSSRTCTDLVQTVGEHNRFIDNGVNQTLLSDLNSLFPTEFAYQHRCSVMIPNLLEPVLLTQRVQLKDQLFYVILQGKNDQSPAGGESSTEICNYCQELVQTRQKCRQLHQWQSAKRCRNLEIPNHDFFRHVKDLTLALMSQTSAKCARIFYDYRSSPHSIDVSPLIWKENVATFVASSDSMRLWHRSALICKYSAAWKISAVAACEFLTTEAS